VTADVRCGQISYVCLVSTLYALLWVFV